MLELKIQNMNCGGCAKSVARVCATVDPTAKVEFDLGEKKVKIESGVGQEKFATALAEAGFPPS